MKIALVTAFVVALIPLISSAESAICTSTVQCKLGTATCSAYTNYETTSECGIDNGKFLACKEHSVNEPLKRDTQSFTYICCKTGGSAFTTKQLSEAQTTCAGI